MIVLRISLIILLLLCLAPLPYGYFQFVRIVAMVGFLYMGTEERSDLKYLFFGLAILFQPLFKIALGREIWNIIDVIVAIGLLISLFIRPKEKHS